MAMADGRHDRDVGAPDGVVLVLGANSLLRGGIAGALMGAGETVEQVDALSMAAAADASVLVAHVEDAEMLDAVRSWRARRRQVDASAALLIVNGASAPLDLRDLLLDGATGVVHADAHPDLIVAILPSIRAGLCALNEATMASVLGAPGQRPAGERDRRLDLLSTRERDVLALLARGLSDKAIARELEITDGTARVHVREILRKLDVSNRTQAALVYVSSGGADDRGPAS